MIKRKLNYPEIGDYVIIDNSWRYNNGINIFLNNNIGYILDISKSMKLGSEYAIVLVSFKKSIESKKMIEEVFLSEDSYGRYLKSFKINILTTSFSKNEEDLKIKIHANKYNL